MTATTRSYNPTVPQSSHVRFQTKLSPFAGKELASAGPGEEGMLRNDSI